MITFYNILISNVRTILNHYKSIFKFYSLLTYTTPGGRNLFMCTNKTVYVTLFELTGTGFLSFAFTMILVIRIHSFFDIKCFTSEITVIIHKCPFGLVVDSVRVWGYSVSVWIDVFHVHWIYSSSCSIAIVITLVIRLLYIFFWSMARKFLA